MDLLFAQTTETAGNPSLGMLMFVLGGLAGAVFYMPLTKVKNWAWESYWMIYALVGLLIMPWLLTLWTAPNALAVIKTWPLDQMGWCILCGALWGIGGLTWGLMIRYLGVGLGLAIGCGLCSACGTLVPPILARKFDTLYDASSLVNAANMSLVAVGISVLGIVMVGMAGMSKENELPEEVKKKSIAEYNFKKGLVIAILSGVMSSALNFGLQGAPEVELKAQHGSLAQIASGGKGKVPESLAKVPGVVFDEAKKVWVAPASPEAERRTDEKWRGMPVLAVVLLGGLAVNVLWCLMLNVKNRTVGDYVKRGAPLLPNLVLGALAGALWCSQFICQKTGEPAMGARAYIGWSVLMASMILFSTLLGIALGEWKNTSGRTKSSLAIGLLLLVASQVASGYSTKLRQEPAPVTSTAIDNQTSLTKGGVL